MGDVAKDLAAGTVGGAANLVCGHPFDTIKVKLQSQSVPLPGQVPKYSGAIHAVKQTIAAEGLGGLYKGMGAPFASVAALTALLFTVRGQMETLLRSQPGAPLTVNQQVVCGAGAGLAVSFLACPTELIKCRLQAQSALVDSSFSSGGPKYGGPMDVARHVLRSEGGARGLFKGLVPTLGREIPGNAAMFGVYEALKQYLAGGQDTSGLSRGSLIAAGGLAGASFWISVYPTDVIKSLLQVDDYKNPRYKGSIDAFKKILASEGVKGLYKGFGPAMARSVPANAACFLTYETISGADIILGIMPFARELLQHGIQVAYFMLCLLLVLAKLQHTTPIRQVATFPAVEDFPPDRASHLPWQTPTMHVIGGGDSPPVSHADHGFGGPSTRHVTLITIGVIVFVSLCVLVVWRYCSRTATSGAATGNGVELQPLRWKCS